MKKTLLIMACSMAIVFTAHSQTITWDGGAGTSNWSDAMNWDTDAVPTASNDVLTDGGDIDITSNVTVQRIRISGGSAVTIASGVTVTIDGFTGNDDGIESTSSSSLTNDGTIIISNILGGSDADGMVMQGPTINNGIINISNVGGSGIRSSNNSITNNGTITVTNVGNSNSDRDHVIANSSTSGGATVLGSIINNGTITITLTNGDEGVLVEGGGSFTNNSMLNINYSGGGDMGIHVQDNSSFTNGAGGVISITDPRDHAVRVDPDGTAGAIFTNAGSLTVSNGNGTNLEHISIVNGGKVSNSGMIDLVSPVDHGIEIRDNAASELENLSGGKITIMNAVDDGIRLASGVVNNDGELLIDGSGSEDIETDNNTFSNTANAIYRPGSSPGDMEIKDDFDFGTSTIFFEINGTAAADFDVIKHANSSNLLTIANATADLNFGFTPADGDCWIIVDAGSTTPTAGMFATVTDNLTAGSITVSKVNGDADVEICFSLVVPVELTSFEGYLMDRGIDLKWETATEINNEGFVIERSNDGNEWQNIGFVEGNGTTQDFEHYTFLDESPMAGGNYYRLKQMDYDGAFEYSEVVYVRNDQELTEFTAYPNPVKNELYLNLDRDISNITIKLVDTNGRLVWNHTGWTQSIPFSDIEAGIYVLSIEGDNFQETRKITKN